MSNSKNIIIGIAGPSGSGKTLFTSKLVKRLDTKSITIIRADDYYNSNHELTPAERLLVNYDHPNSIDQELLISHLEELRNGNSIQMPIYDYTENMRKKEEFKLVHTNRIIILEGFLILALKKVKALLDIKIYVDTPLDICLSRRIKRDVVERGWKISEILTQYHNNVRPMFLKYIEPSKKHADIIVPRGGKNSIAIEIIKARINELGAVS